MKMGGIGQTHSSGGGGGSGGGSGGDDVDSGGTGGTPYTITQKATTTKKSEKLTLKETQSVKETSQDVIN